MDFILACDIMLDVEGSIRPAMYLASELVSKGHNVSMISPIITGTVKNHISSIGITPISFGARLVTRNAGLSLSWLETWAREAFLGLNSRGKAYEASTVINFSQVIAIPSSVWYLQGPPSIALRDMENELSSSLRVAYRALRPILEWADTELISKMGKTSSMVIANSKFCASMYSGFGVKADEVIYPPIDCGTFHPTTKKPTCDYVLTYFGKETKFSAIKSVADMGIKIKAFGSKTRFIPRQLVKHPNVECLGRVSTDELVDLYSNALLTLFPFTHEPFGYVPLESMACGTPVITNDIQGPSEYVNNNYTGWLVRTDQELTQKVVQVWKEKYPHSLRQNCTKVASRFDRKPYVEKWLQVLAMAADEDSLELQMEFPENKVHA